VQMDTVTKMPIVLSDFAIVCQIITNPLASVGNRPVELRSFCQFQRVTDRPSFAEATILPSRLKATQSTTISSSVPS
jgi:hypothetical protein